jgi:hypothetical protein
VSFVLEHRDLGNGSTKDPSIYIYGILWNIPTYRIL